MAIGWNRRMKKFVFVDLVLALLAVFFGTLAVIKIFPFFLGLGLSLSIPLCIACAIRPIYVFWIKDESGIDKSTGDIGWTRRTKKFGLFEEKIAQTSLVFFILAMAKPFPEIFDMSLWLSIPLTVICAYDPLYVFWVKDEVKK